MTTQQTRLFLPMMGIVLGFSFAPMTRSQRLTKATIDEAAPSGANYDKAEFRLWIPNDAGTLKAAVILVPGSNGDGRSMVEDPDWQAFATKHKLALVGVSHEYDHGTVRP